MPCAQSREYNEAIQNLGSCVSDEELRHGQPALNALGVPMPFSGNFADVYKVHCPATGNTWAVKCFTREIPGLKERYREISAHLNQARLPFMVDFHYIEPGIHVGRQWHPFLKMRWVEGLALSEFVEKYLDRPATLRQLLRLWEKLAVRLREAEIAHADLQHGNVLLVPLPQGQFALRLIDYDGMYVPALAGTRSAELGHPAYQHPQRLRERIFSLEVDRFSHLAIFCAIRCLIVGKRDLWQFHTGENLLFRERDFADPENSQVFRALWALPDAEARALVGRLFLALQAPLAQTPLLGEMLSNGSVVPLSGEEESKVESALGRRVVVSQSSPVPSPEDILSETKSSWRAEATATLPEAPPTEMVGTLPDAVSGTQPTPVETGRQSGAKGLGFGARLVRGAWNPAAAVFRWADGALRSLVGEENVILHNFLRLAAVVVLVGLFFVGVYLAPKRAPDESDVPPLPTLRLEPIAAATIALDEALEVAVSVENAEHWQGKLRYRLDPEAPVGASIDAATGVFAWTPRGQQTFGQYEVAIFVEGCDGQSDQTSLTIRVTPALRIARISTQTISLGESLQLAVSVEHAEQWEGKLRYRLGPGAPAGASIDAAMGVLTWTPVGETNPGEYNVPILVEAPEGQRDLTSLTIRVTPALRIERMSAQTIRQGESLEVAVSVENADYWQGKLRYRLGRGAPVDASIDAATGVFAWTPGGQQALGEYEVAILVEGSDLQRDQTSLTIRVTPALRIARISTQTIPLGRSLRVAVSVEHAEQSEGKLQYSLGPGAPSGAKIDPATGRFTWTPTQEQGAGTYEVTVLATPPEGLSDQESFVVTVREEITVDLGRRVTLEMVRIPAGEFLMGSPDSDRDAQSEEKPQHRVRITEPFYLGKYEVTQEQWQAVMGSNPSQFKGPRNPVDHVSWDDCQAFLGKLNKRHAKQQGGTGGTFRLPTEAEWEYACRAGSSTRWCFGDDEGSLGDYAWHAGNSWYAGDSETRTHVVGRKRPNAWGLYDVHGNVWEWCSDSYDADYYAESPGNDPTGPSSGSNRVWRGGGWTGYPKHCRAADRGGHSPGARTYATGFRVLREAVE